MGGLVTAEENIHLVEGQIQGWPHGCLSGYRRTARSDRHVFFRKV